MEKELGEEALPHPQAFQEPQQHSNTFIRIFKKNQAHTSKTILGYTCRSIKFNELLEVER